MNSRSLCSLGTLFVAVPVLAAVFAAVPSAASLPSPALSSKMSQQSGMQDAAVKPGEKAKIQASYASLPLQFEPNRGQTAKTVDYVARGSGYALFLTPGSAVVELQDQGSAKSAQKNPMRSFKHQQLMARRSDRVSVLRMKILGAHRSSAEGLEELPGKANYLSSSNTAQWHTNLATYGKVRYPGVYPGIDLVYYGNQHQLEYDFVVAPGANPSSIRMEMDGQSAMKVDSAGNLVLHSASGPLSWHKPVVYQNVGSVRRPVAGSYQIVGPGQVAFHIARYDHSRPLVIDPTLVYSTYRGGTGMDSDLGIVSDDFGNAYVCGYTTSMNYPITPGVVQPTEAGGADAVVYKLNPTGSAVVYSTYLGGSGNDYAYAITLDSAGNAYVTGTTSSRNFPVTPGAVQQTYGGGPETGFITELNSTGSALVYSTYLGGSGDDGGFGIRVDASGNTYATGWSTSKNFPTTPNAFQRTHTGGYGAWVAKLTPHATSLIYSTYYGGMMDDYSNYMVIDSAGDAYVAGLTDSPDFFTTPGAYQRTLMGTFDGFVTELNPTGSGVVFSTLIGGTGYDEVESVALGPQGNIFLAGHTYSADYPVTAGAYQTTFKGGMAGMGGPADAFVTELNSTGSSLMYSTFLGGNGFDIAWGTGVDCAGDIYIGGFTSSSDFPTTPDAVQRNFGGMLDAYFAELDPTGSKLLYSTYLGGNQDDRTWGFFLNNTTSNAYIVGHTMSMNFPTTPGVVQPTSTGTQDGFIVKFAVPMTCASSTPCGKVTGGGWISANNTKANFGFEVQSKKGQVKGHLNYVDHSNGLHVDTGDVKTLTINGNQAEFTGTAMVNGHNLNFIVDVQDNGEPGAGSDTFSIRLSNGYSNSGVLGGGNIKIHKCKGNGDDDDDDNDHHGDNDHHDGSDHGGNHDH